MNVIFLDFDGTLNTSHDKEDKELELKRIKLLADICHEYNCKVVIESAHKDDIDEKTLEVNPDVLWLKEYFDLFKKYGIEVIGITPSIIKWKSKYSYTTVWKEDEIRLYLMRHLDIDHYCILDDDDLGLTHQKSDLDKVRKHLVQMNNYDMDNPETEGLLPKHKEEIGKVLELDNDIKKMVLKRRNKMNL